MNEQLKDEEVKKEYDKLEPEFSIVQAIIDAKKSLGLTNGELAKKAGMTQEDMIKLENGNAAPSIRTLQRLALAMGKKLRIEFA